MFLLRQAFLVIFGGVLVLFLTAPRPTVFNCGLWGGVRATHILSIAAEGLPLVVRNAVALLHVIFYRLVVTVKNSTLNSSSWRGLSTTRGVRARFNDFEGVQFGLRVGFGTGSDWPSSRLYPQGRDGGSFFIAQN